MLGVIWGGASSLSFGTADFVARLSSARLGPESALLGMLMVGVVVLSVAVWLTGTPGAFTAHDLALVAISGAMNTIGLLFLYMALATGPVSIAAPIAASQPAFIVALSLPLGVVPSAWQWVGMVVTIAGVVALSRAGDHFAASGAFTRDVVRRTALLALIAAIGLSLQVITAQEVTETVGALPTTWAGRCAAFVALLAWLLARRRAVRLPLAWWPALIAQGSLDAAGVLTLLYGSVGTDRAVVAVVSSTFSVVTVLLARLYLKERVSARQWATIGVALTGIAILAAVD